MELHPNVSEFFHGAVTSSLSSLKVAASEPTEFYRVNLLVECTKSTGVSDEPLALKMAQVAHASPEERLRGLREIGDTSLCMSGFFADSLNRKLVDVNYYIAMGGAAYGQLAHLMTVTHGSATHLFRTVFNELSTRFELFVEVLKRIRRSTTIGAPMPTDSNLVLLYEEWVKTGSEWLEKRLRESGLIAREAFAGGKQIH